MLATTVFAIAVLTNGRGIDAGIYVLIESLRGWPPGGGEVDGLVRLGRFLVSWWWAGVLVLSAAAWVAATVAAIFNARLRGWERIVWLLLIWLAPPLSIPAYCLVSLRRTRT